MFSKRNLLDVQSIIHSFPLDSAEPNPSRSTDDIQYAKMRIISSPNIQLRDIIRALLTSTTSSSDLFSTILTYGQLIGASSLHGYLVDRSYDSQTLINDEYSSYQGVALCLTFDRVLTDQQWEDIFGIHESKKSSAFFHLTDFLCVLSGSRVVYYDPNERMINDERSYVSIFDLEKDDIETFRDQFSPFEYFLSKSKKFFNGTLIRLPLRACVNGSISTNIQTLDELKQDIIKYFSSIHCLIEFFLNQTQLTTIKFDYTKDFQDFSPIIFFEKQSLGVINDSQSKTQVIQFNSNLKFIENHHHSSIWIFSNQKQPNNDFKFVLPLNSLAITNHSGHYQCIQLTATKILYCHSNENSLIEFPCAYALFLKDLSRLIKPTAIGHLSLDFIWELMPDCDEYSKYALQQSKTIRTIEKSIPQIWEEIGKQELFYSVTEGWGYVAIEDMIINNVESGPIQDVLTYVFSEANAPIVILPTHVINGLCKYSNKHYLQVMTPFHASELLAKNASLLSRLTSEQKLSLLKYIVFNDPDPGLVLELELLPLANQTFTNFQTKQSSCIYLFDHNREFLKLFSIHVHGRFLNPNIDENLYETLSSSMFQGKQNFTQFSIG